MRSVIALLALLIAGKITSLYNFTMTDQCLQDKANQVFADTVQSENGIETNELSRSTRKFAEPQNSARSSKGQRKSNRIMEGESSVVPIFILSAEWTKAKVPDFILWTCEHIIGNDLKSSKALDHLSQANNALKNQI